MMRKLLATSIAMAIGIGSLNMASARSFSAGDGKATDPTKTTAFTHSLGVGTVIAHLTGPGTLSWFACLPIDNSGTKTVTVAARAVSSTPDSRPTIRLVSNDIDDGQFEQSGPVPIPVSATFTRVTLSIHAPSFGILLLEARLNDGATLGGIVYNP